MRRAHLVFISAFLVVLTTLGAFAITPPQTVALKSRPYFGVNISGPEFSPWNGQTFPSAADWAYLGSLNVPYVRLPIAWESMQTTLNGSLAAGYLASVKSALASANQYGIKVIVDVHNFGSYCQSADWTSSGCGYAGNGGATGTGVNFIGDGTLSSANLTNLWTALSTALVGLPGLGGYEIMNEPSNLLLSYSTNELFAPNGFNDNQGSQPWSSTNAGSATQLGNGTNPISGYGPAWNLTATSGFGGVQQLSTLAAVSYIGSCYAKVASGTKTFFIFIGGSAGTFTATTTFQRFAFANTPSAGSNQFAPVINSANDIIEIANCQLEKAAASGSSSSISGATLTVGGTVAGTFAVGQWIVVNAGGVSAQIISLGTGSGGAGTYNLGSSPGNASSVAISGFSAYQPSPIISWEQAAITAIRAVDTTTPIYVNGFNAATACSWQSTNYELNSLTGGNLIFDAHQYFDGNAGTNNLAACGGGGTYSSNYSSYTTSTIAGAQLIEPFLSWLQQTNSRGFIGESGIPNLNTDSNANWFLVANSMFGSVRAAGIKSTMWFYGANGVQSGNILNIARSSGKTDPRLSALLQWH